MHTSDTSFFFKRVLFLDLLNILQSMFYLSSGASVKSRQVSKSKHKLHLAEKEVGGAHGCLALTPLERQDTHRSTPSSHSTADGEVGSGILTAITTGRWEPIGSQNCVLLPNKRTSPFRQFNFVWHFLALRTFGA